MKAATSTTVPSRRALRQAVAAAGRHLWQALERMGEARGRRELLALADRWAPHQAALAAELRRAAFHDNLR